MAGPDFSNKAVFGTFPAGSSGAIDTALNSHIKLFVFRTIEALMPSILDAVLFWKETYGRSTEPFVWNDCDHDLVISVSEDGKRAMMAQSSVGSFYHDFPVLVLESDKVITRDFTIFDFSDIYIFQAYQEPDFYKLPESIEEMVDLAAELAEYSSASKNDRWPDRPSLKWFLDLVDRGRLDVSTYYAMGHFQIPDKNYNSEFGVASWTRGNIASICHYNGDIDELRCLNYMIVSAAEALRRGKDDGDESNG